MKNKSKRKKISIVIVNYKVEKELISCIASIIKSKPKVNYEIIVIDNDTENYIEKKLKQRFSDILYIKSSRNLGYGAGNNLGAQYASGEYLFFVNPDTEVSPKSINVLVDFLENNQEAGIVAPLFLDKNNKPYQQGSKKLTPLRAIFTLSFLHKLFPNNSISRAYLLSDWKKNNIKEVDVVPGTGFMIRKKNFDQVGGFDKNFFLYFEEFDLCNRIKNLGYKIYIFPKAKVRHLWEVSTKKADFDIKKVFQESRFYYFKKYYGEIPALIVEVCLRLNKVHLLMIAILTLGTILRLYRLDELMPFIGDQGWFYLSARDLILNGNIPLVGITASHTWLHQGPFWTYMLSVPLWVFNFNPVTGAYLTVFIDIISIVILYKLCSELFSKQTGIIAGLLYATSPLIIFNSRFSYHTSPIPLFTVLFIYFLFKWIKGKKIYFPLTIFMLVILYNLELATFTLSIAFVGIIFYGFLKKENWFNLVLQKRIIILSLLAFVFPMLPIIIYDFGNGFPQTVGFAAWVGYKAIGFLTGKADLTAPFLYNNIQKFFFLENSQIAVFLFFSSVLYLFYSTYKMFINKKYHAGYVLIGYLFIIVSSGFIVNKTLSDAYLPIFFPILIILLALFVNKIIQRRMLSYFGIVLLFAIILFNAYSVLDYYREEEKNVTFADRIKASEKIIKYTSGKEYNLIGIGWLGDFENYTMNYEYLTWWLGNAPVKSPRNFKIYVMEDAYKIEIEKVDKTL